MAAFIVRKPAALNDRFNFLNRPERRAVDRAFEHRQPHDGTGKRGHVTARGDPAVKVREGRFLALHRGRIANGQAFEQILLKQPLLNQRAWPFDAGPKNFVKCPR